MIKLKIRIKLGKKLRIKTCLPINLTTHLNKKKGLTNGLNFQYSSFKYILIPFKGKNIPSCQVTCI